MCDCALCILAETVDCTNETLPNVFSSVESCVTEPAGCSSEWGSSAFEVVWYHCRTSAYVTVVDVYSVGSGALSKSLLERWPSIWPCDCGCEVVLERSECVVFDSGWCLIADS